MSTTTSSRNEVAPSQPRNFQHHTISWASWPWDLVKWVVTLIYGLIQRVIILLFKPHPPTHSDGVANPYGRVAIVGAGLTGVSSAAHAIAHGFEVVIYESRRNMANVNSTSGLQLNSMLYRFHPAIIWSREFSHHDEILGATPSELRKSDSDPDIDPKKGGHARWIINNAEDEIFDVVIVTVGTCGAPQWIGFEGMPEGFVERKKAETQHDIEQNCNVNNASDNDSGMADASTERESSPSEAEGKDKHKKKMETNTYHGTILHSPQLDSADVAKLEGKTVVVVGSGASGVEAVETTLSRGAERFIMSLEMTSGSSLAICSSTYSLRCNHLADRCLSASYGRRFYGAGNITASRSLYRHIVVSLRGCRYVVNDEFLGHVRSGKCAYLRGDTLRLTSRGALVNKRARDSRPGDAGEETELDADVIVLATGFEKRKIDFLPDDLFPEGYARPDLYLQNFATEDWSVRLTNSAYTNAIGTVHIGIYTCILLTLLLDEGARPVLRDMKLWVDVVRFLKRGAKRGALSFFTYMELTIWILLFHLVSPDRLPWLPFIMFGWGFIRAPTELVRVVLSQSTEGSRTVTNVWNNLNKDQTLFTTRTISFLRSLFLELCDRAVAYRGS